MRLRIADEAVRDLRGIGQYIARDNPQRARSFVAELSATIREVGERPLSFPARSELAPGLRSALHKPYLILFRVEGETAQILRVLHGARDIGNLF